MAKNENTNGTTSILKRIWANAYARNIIYAILVFIAIIFLSKWFLSCATRHGEIYAVPDFKGMVLNDAEKLAKQNSLRITVSDSIFVTTIPPGAVIEQKPAANDSVKKNRTIYLTINCFTPKKVEVPNVVGYSLRQAKGVLLGHGIRIGKLTYREDMAMNNVIGQRCKDVISGRIITNEDDTKATVYIGDEVELIVGLGDNPDARYTYVPNVVGRSIDEAKSMLVESYLNVGKITYDSTIKTAADKRNAVVKSQSPGGEGSSRRSLGENVDITFTLKKQK